MTNSPHQIVQSVIVLQIISLISSKFTLSNDWTPIVGNLK